MWTFFFEKNLARGHFLTFSNSEITQIDRINNDKKSRFLGRGYDYGVISMT